MEPIKKSKYSITELNGFPVPVLQIMIAYLDAPTASSFARVCRGHMIICYFYAISVLGWSKTIIQRLFSGFIKPFSFPPDAFIRMQIAKICVVAAMKPSQSLHSLHDVSLLESHLTQFENYPLTYREYYEKVAFVPENEINGLIALRPIDNMIVRNAIDVLTHSIEAKCLCMIALARFDDYKTLRPKSLQFRNTSLFLTESLIHLQPNEPRIVIAELNLVTDDDHTYAVDILYDHYSSSGSRQFCTENPAILHVLLKKFERSELGLDILFFEKRGLQRCLYLRDTGFITNQDILDNLDNAWFFQQGEPDDYDWKFPATLDGIRELEIENDIVPLLDFQPTRRRVLDAIRNIIRLFKENHASCIQEFGEKWCNKFTKKLTQLLEKYENIK